MKTIVIFIFVLAGCARTPPALEFETPVRVNDLDGGFAQAEPAIAARGDLVAVSWIDWRPPRPLVRLALSTNGGASFGASMPVEDPAREHSDGQADPTLEVGADGRVRVAWLACGRDDGGFGGRRCDLRTRVRERGAWSAATAVTNSVVYRERPWLLGNGVLSWSEVTAGGKWRWIVASEKSGFDPSLIVDDRSTPLKAALAGERLEALLVDRNAREPLRLALVRVEGSLTGIEEKERIEVPRPAVLLDYSYGAIAADESGARRVAWVIGDGKRNDLVSSGARLRDAGTRVALPWIEAAGNGRFVAAWIEERSDGWRVMARPLGPGARMGSATDVGREPFRFATASLTLNIGDYLQATSSQGSVWIAWSDTRDGDADVYVARARLPGG